MITLSRASGFFAVLLGLAFLLAILYVGLNMAETRSQQLVGLKETSRALSFTSTGKGLIITFADRDFLFPWKYYGHKLRNIITELTADI